MNDLVEQVEVFFKLNPHYGYLPVAIVLLVFSIGHFKGWHWAVNPEGKSKTLFLYNWLGESLYKKVMGVFFMLGALGAFTAFYLSK